jgi:hypothetical protein
MSLKETGVPVKDTPNAAELLRSYSGFGFLQTAGLFTRPCVGCGCRVTNQNLGGNSRKSALIGDLWCLRCADGRIDTGARVGSLESNAGVFRS